MMALNKESDAPTVHSVVFPMLPPDVLMSDLGLQTQLGEIAIVKPFRQWTQINSHLRHFLILDYLFNITEES